MPAPSPHGNRELITLFLCGDVMTGRGVDQVLMHPGDPTLHEPVVSSAIAYVELAERQNGRIAAPVSADWIWGDALAAWQYHAPDLRIVNLETAITTSTHHWPGKGIHYRMHPDNVACLTAAALDCCVLANNHVLDWGHSGLRETLASLDAAHIASAGAGLDDTTAWAPSIHEIAGKGRVLVFAACHDSSGVPATWAAVANRPGVNRLDDLSHASVLRCAEHIDVVRQAGDRVVFSLHWGSNWCYHIPDAHRGFARRLIDLAGVDIVHGHSSHHPLAFEVCHDRLILYGCGDFINDYEGIGGCDQFRGDLALMYFAGIDADSGRLRALTMTPLRRRRFRLEHAPPGDAQWLADTMTRECARFGARLTRRPGGLLTLERDGTAGAPRSC